MRRVLVTGGAGFIGSHLVDRLVSEGYEVVVLDDLSSGSLDNIAVHLGKGYLRLVRGDVRDRGVVREALRGVDAVVHLAALISVDDSLRRPVEYFEVNAWGTLTLLEEALRAGVERLVYASSTAVYGDHEPPLREDMPPRPLSPYAASKAAAEAYCQAYHHSYGLETVVLRYFNVYGPRQEGNPYAGVISRFVRWALRGEPLIVYGDGEQTRDFIHVSDVVEATLRALHSPDAPGEVVNVCTGTPTSVNKLADLVRELAGADVPVVHVEPRPGEVRHSHGDPSKAWRILGFKARVSLEEGLRDLVEYYRGLLASPSTATYK